MVKHLGDFFGVFFCSEEINYPLEAAIGLWEKPSKLY
jgi:hypothetical protein